MASRVKYQGTVEIKALRVGYFSDEELLDLSNSLEKKGFEARSYQPVSEIRAFAPAYYIDLVVDAIAEHGIEVLLVATMTWARRLWRRSRRLDKRPIEVTIYGPRGQVLKSVQVKGGPAKDITEEKRSRVRKARAWRRQRSRGETT